MAGRLAGPDRRSQLLYPVTETVGTVPVYEWDTGAPISAMVTENGVFTPEGWQPDTQKDWDVTEMFDPALADLVNLREFRLPMVNTGLNGAKSLDGGSGSGRQDRFYSRRRRWTC